MLHIDLQKNGLTLNGVFMEAVEPGRWAELLGEPRETLFEGKAGETVFLRKVWIWDDLGVLLNIPVQENQRHSLELRFAADPEGEKRALFPYFDLNPKGLFVGKITFDGKALWQTLTPRELDGISSCLDKTIGSWQVYIRLQDEIAQQIKLLAGKGEKAAMLLERLSGDNPPYTALSVAYEPPKVKSASPKYRLRKATDKDLAFDNFNFKLAVIEELMYNQKVLKPEFDVYEFCGQYDKREIDPDDYYDEIIPEVKAWFEALPIPKALAEKVGQIYLDGGNEVFLQLIPQWHGEDGIFDIQAVSEAEFAQFPRLKTIDGTALMMSETAKRFFEGKGVDIMI